MAVRVAASSPRILRQSSWDSLLVALSVVHAALLLTVPSVLLVALGLWWNANTISHNFIHRPFFGRRSLNVFYSMYLSALLGIPQSLWRRRHLRHHAETPAGIVPAGVTIRPLIGGQVWIEIGIVSAVWCVFAAIAPRTFLRIYLPGYALGLGLCFLQGHFEHARGTTSHYGWLYNLLFFNDGYHVEHHERPAEHWTRLRALGHRDPQSSRWPPVLRWLEVVNLELLERLVLRSSALQRFVVRRHERAFRALLPRFAAARRVVIVGGGLFPRTALILRRLLPNATLTIVDVNARNLETARRFLGEGVRFVHAPFEPRLSVGADLVVTPLAFFGDRNGLYRQPPAPALIVHDWMWAPRPDTAPVSWLLLKRLNFVAAEADRGLRMTS